MSPFEWAMVIMTALSTAGALTSGQDIEEESTAPPGGAAPQDIKPVFGAGGPGGFALPTSVKDVPTLEGPTQAATAAAAATPQTAVTTPPELVGPPESRAGTGEPEGTGIGQILAALPKALVAAAPLLGLGDQPIPEQRPAPVAGGQPGQPVGSFAQPFGPGQIDIARLLAALPGIRG